MKLYSYADAYIIKGQKYIYYGWETIVHWSQTNVRM